MSRDSRILSPLDRDLRRDQSIDRHLGQLAGVRLRDAELGAQRERHLVRLVAHLHVQARPALDDGAMEESLRLRHAEQRRDLPAAARLAEDGDVPGIAAECADVVAHPLERLHEVEHAGVAGGRVALAEQIAEMQIAERAESMVDGDQHDVAATAQVDAVVDQARARSGGEAAAVEPHQDRPLAAIDRRRPHVEEEAVLARVGRRLRGGER